jgi:hypothetical protein
MIFALKASAHRNAPLAAGTKQFTREKSGSDVSGHCFSRVATPKHLFTTQNGGKQHTKLECHFHQENHYVNQENQRDHRVREELPGEAVTWFGNDSPNRRIRGEFSSSGNVMDTLVNNGKHTKSY